MTTTKNGLALIISGPSGVGKSTIVGHLEALRPGLRFSISCTTRDPRPGEIDGVHYHFLTQERFEQMLASGGFLESAQVHGNYYGTPKEPVTTAVDEGAVILLDIDVQGMRLVRQALAGTPYETRLRTVFIAPPDLQELERRLRGRGTETPESLARRLKNAAGEMACADEYQHTVVNRDAQEAARQLLAIIAAP